MQGVWGYVLLLDKSLTLEEVLGGCLLLLLLHPREVRLLGTLHVNTYHLLFNLVDLADEIQ